MYTDAVQCRMFMICNAVIKIVELKTVKLKKTIYLKPFSENRQIFQMI